MNTQPRLYCVELDSSEFEEPLFQAYLRDRHITATPCPTEENNMMGIEYIGTLLDLVLMIQECFMDDSDDDVQLDNELINFIQPIKG